VTDRPLITAIVPAFNAARFLPAAIESLRWQEYAPMEILVIDDGSTDDTAEVARSLGPDVRCVRQANAGPSAARNHGLRLARGEFTGFLDADDQWPREKVSIQMARLLAQPDLDAVLGRIQYVALPGAELPGFAFEGEDHTMTHVHLGSGLFHRRAFDKVGYFDESTRFCEDVDWFFRAREESLRMVILRATTLCYRLHDQNMTLDRSSADRLLAPVFKKSLDRRRLKDGQVRPLPRWLSYDEYWPGRAPLVSAVIPAYNAQAYVAQAIESVLAQTYAPVEIVVVDDGSDDGTERVVRGFGPRVRLYRQAHGGPGAARNLGVAKSTGPLLAFLDADDLWMPDKLERQVEALQQSSECGMVFGMVQQFQQGGGTEPPQPGHFAGTLLVRREAFNKVGPFAEDLHVAEFIDWYARATDLGLTWRLLDQVVLRRRIHGENLGVRERSASSDYLHVLKDALDRRRRRTDTA
jgi:glycosyltransferase involved in cell wall biosynthesis